MLKKLITKLRNPRQSSPDTHVLTQQQHGLSIDQFSRNSAAAAKKLQDAGFQAFIVGGSVRDALLGENPKDFDVATSATPEQVRALFRNSRIIGRRFKLVHLYHGREIVEVATFRGSHQDCDGDDERSSQHESGRILRDNVYGTLEEDALRRDFTINALYYNVSNQCVYDFAEGVTDIHKRSLRLIGDPEQRYLEDPVRMLRAIRFAAKLGFTIEPDTAEPIRRLAPLLADIPPARLFDEVLKLFLNGQAELTFDLLLEYDLFTPLFPATAQAITNNPDYSLRLIRNALRNTDKRIADGKTITPAFLFAALLWPAIPAQAARLQENGMPPVPAVQEAAQLVLSQQLSRISIPKRFTLPTREIWALQERLPRRTGKRADAVLAHPRFRAGYDFLLLRESAGEETNHLGEWWTDYQELDEAQRRAMIRDLGGPTKKTRRPRKRRANNPFQHKVPN
ncbi:MAG: polynucleotide adenylyltransferase PcnB [Gammaproteobacteria bacterium]|nr:polynucleotide adenylyltransferase PcnB [Gammaproteobacteria bacterium]